MPLFLKTYFIFVAIISLEYYFHLHQSYFNHHSSTHSPLITSSTGNNVPQTSPITCHSTVTHDVPQCNPICPSPSTIESVTMNDRSHHILLNNFYIFLITISSCLPLIQSIDYDTAPTDIEYEPYHIEVEHQSLGGTYYLCPAGDITHYSSYYEHEAATRPYLFDAQSHEHFEQTHLSFHLRSHSVHEHIINTIKSSSQSYSVTNTPSAHDLSPSQSVTFNNYYNLSSHTNNTIVYQSDGILCQYLGPSQCVYLGIDDKCKDPMGILAANKQQSILMRMEYQIKLTDHTFADSEHHKLTPSVYAVCTIDEGQFGNAKAVSYSGPTYITVRSGKHETATTYDHGIDIKSMYNDPAFKSQLWIANKPKPVLIARTDGGPDQNIRNSGTIQMYYNLFKTLDLDMILVSMSAPVTSAYNEVGNRMAPLSDKLVNVVIDHKKLGNRLDANGNTIHEHLEKQNFEAVGGVLSGIWNDTEIDGYSVKAPYIEPISKENKLAQFEDYTQEFEAKHFNHGHCHFPIIKCQDQQCCGVHRSNAYDILQSKKYPAPRYFIASSQ